MWVDSFAVVKFDDELGQVVAHECPEESVRRLRWRGGAPRPHAPRRQLSSRDQRDLAFAAMPDSHSGGSELDMAYVFAMRPAEDRPGHSAQTRLAFTYFRRIREPASARGYRQTSVVLLAALPFHSLFLKVVRRLGRLYFAFGLPILEVAMATLDAWPAPQPGAEMHLPFMGLHLHFRCPAAEPSPAFLSLAGAQPAFPRLYQDLPLYSSFASFPQCLWHMWQRVLCGESVAVYSASPQQCSAAVLALASLIAPIEYRGEVHPYLTIYDSNYSRVVHPYSHTRRRHSSDRSPAFGSAMRSLRAAVTATGLSPRSSSGPEAAEADEATDAPPPPPPRLVGVTNPLFCKNAPTWPNLLVLPSATSASASTSGDVGKSRAPFSMPYGRIPTPPGLTSGRGVASRAFSPKVLSPAAPLPEVGADGRAGGTVFSRARPLVPVFRDVLAQLLPVDRISMPVAGQDSPSRPGRAGIMNAAEHSLLVSTSGCAFVDSTGSGVEEASVRLPAAPHRTLGSREAGSHAKTSAAAAEAGAAPAREGSDESSDESGSDEARGWELGDDESDSVVPAVAINDSTLRQHFRHLTLAFLKPFRHFLTVAVSPPTGVVHAYADADELLRPFSEVALMARLAETGPPPPFGRCSEWKELYRRFVRSPHFRPWFAGQRQRAVARCGCILDKLRMGLDPEQLLAHTLRMEVDDRVSVYYRIVDAIDSVVRRRMRPSEGAARDSSDDSDNSDSGNGGDSGGGDGLLPIMHAHLRAVQDSLPASVLEAVVRSHGRSPHSSSSAGDP